QLGGAGLVAGALVERPQDPLALPRVAFGERRLGERWQRRSGGLAHEAQGGAHLLERKMAQLDALAPALKERAVDHVLELAHVARPRMGAQRLEGVGGELRLRPASARSATLGQE